MQPLCVSRTKNGTTIIFLVQLYESPFLHQSVKGFRILSLRSRQFLIVPKIPSSSMQQCRLFFLLKGTQTCFFNMKFTWNAFLKRHVVRVIWSVTRICNPFGVCKLWLKSCNQFFLLFFLSYPYTAWLHVIFLSEKVVTLNPHIDESTLIILNLCFLKYLK